LFNIDTNIEAYTGWGSLIISTIVLRTEEDANHAQAKKSDDSRESSQQLLDYSPPNFQN
jgi:hypothetical protein